ncbi:MAG TPA: hypothetical protein VF070_37320 [Streptosporangiaceae bacterium]
MSQPTAAGDAAPATMQAVVVTRPGGLDAHWRSGMWATAALRSRIGRGIAGRERGRGETGAAIPRPSSPSTCTATGGARGAAR